VENSEYHKKDGISLLKARHAVNGPFLLLMSDHIFVPDTAACLLRQRLEKDESILAVDLKLDDTMPVDRRTRIGVQLHSVLLNRYRHALL
jgi:choline kinase